MVNEPRDGGPDRGPSRGEQIEPGDVFGRLTVTVETAKQGWHRMWECECACGEVVTVRASDLRRRTRSCGCTGGRPIKEDGIDRGYERIHARLRLTLGPATSFWCADCTDLADQWSYIGGCANAKKSREGFPYCQHEGHYQPRCYRCHGTMDRGPEASVRRLRAVFLSRI